MNKHSNLVISGLIVALVVVALGAFWVIRTNETVIQVQVQNEESLAGTNPEVITYMRVHGYFMQGGSINATSTGDTTQTLLATDMLEHSILDLNPITASTTYTLPASTTFPTIANPGEIRSWIFRNATTSSNVNVTIAAGTGIDLQEPDGQNVIIGINNFAWLTCYRKADTDIVCLINESIPAD